MAYKVAVVGATGNVGREMLQILAERNFPVSEVVALASENSVGKQVSYGEDKELNILALKDYDFTGTDIVLSSAGGHVSEQFVPRATDAGAIVIDNTSRYRMEPDVPLVVPEVNPEALAGYRQRNIIANPNCSTIQMLVALKPLHDAATIKRVVVSTYQSVSGAGREAMDELFGQTRGIYMNINPDMRKGQSIFPKQMAFNVIPHIDTFMKDGSTREEWKMKVETQKILGSGIEVLATCVRVPVFTGHAETIAVEFENPLSVEEARRLLQKAKGVSVVDHHEDGGYVTPVECAGEDSVYVSRLRHDTTVEHGLAFWCVADNVRKGAALNAVQIAEVLIQDYWNK